MKTKDHKHKFQLSVILVCKIKQTILKLDVYMPADILKHN